MAIRLRLLGNRTEKIYTNLLFTLVLRLSLRLIEALIENEQALAGELYCMKKSRLMVAGSAVTLALSVGVPAWAQSTTVEQEAVVDDDSAAEEDAGSIVVTGSRIRRPNLDSTIPVTSVGAEQITETGQISVGDQLN